MADDSNPDYVPGELIVWFASQAEVSTQEMEQIYTTAHAQIGAEPVKTLSALGHTNIQLVQIPAETSVQQAAQDYLSIGGVKYAEPNYILETQKTPNDPYYGFLWGMDTIMAPSAWEYTTGSKAVIVAVVDSGVDYTHEDLKANIWTNPGEVPNNGIDDDRNGYIDDYYGWNFAYNNADPMDIYGHGTHVAGTIGAVGNNGAGITGVNWNLSIMAVKGLDNSGSGTMFGLISSIIYASNMGADVINNSWGSGNTPSALLEETVRQSPAVVVFAAGNENRNLDASPNTQTISGPNVILVAAAGENGDPASFTNYGKKSVQVAAPGVSIYSTTPNNNYEFRKGTSMATPHVSGLAALLKAADPSLSAAEIKNIIMETVTPGAQWSERVAAGGIINAASAIAKVHEKDLKASFTIDVTEEYAPLFIRVTDTSKGNPTSWTWDFGDETLPQHGKTATHTYTEAGVQEITLHVSDGIKSSRATQTIMVKPKASITGAPRHGPAPLDVTFTISNTGGAGTGYITSGDGAIIQIPHATGEPETHTHSYQNAGVYTVAYYFEKSHGISDLIEHMDYITVSSVTPTPTPTIPPTATPTATPTVPPTIPPTITPTITPTVTPTPIPPIGTQINLHTGWNLVSVPGRLQEGTNTAMIFAHVPSGGHSLLTYETGADSWIIVKALDIIQPLNGYWIYAESPCVVPLHLDTNPIMVPPSRKIDAGWSLIGMAGLSNVTARDGLLPVRQQWAFLIGFDAKIQQYETSIINGGSDEHNDAAHVFPYKGYWLFMREPGTIAGL